MYINFESFSSEDYGGCSGLKRFLTSLVGGTEALLFPIMHSLIFFGPLSYMRRVVICQFHEGTGDYILYLCAKVKNNNRTGRAGSRDEPALSPAQSSARGARSDLGTEDGNVKKGKARGRMKPAPAR